MCPSQWFFHFGEEIINCIDEYQMSMADVPVYPIVSGEGEQYEPLHCHEG
jgi:hypothetical protein